jgi:uncharacterized protein YwqG
MAAGERRCLVGTMWGESGILYFWIRRDDLRARRFDKVWMTLQCH